MRTVVGIDRSGQGEKQKKATQDREFGSTHTSTGGPKKSWHDNWLDHWAPLSIFIISLAQRLSTDLVAVA